MRITIGVNGQEREIELPESTVRALQRLAARNGLPIEEMLQQAVAEAEYIEDTLASGERILVGNGGRFRKLELA